MGIPPLCLWSAEIPDGCHACLAFMGFGEILILVLMLGYNALVQ